MQRWNPLPLFVRLMHVKYILDGKMAIACDDLDKWIEWWKQVGNEGRIVAQDQVGDVLVSTVFLAINHQFRPHGPPLIFETMVFGGPLDQEQRRYSTWEEAEAGHKEILAAVKAPHLA